MRGGRNGRDAIEKVAENLQGNWNIERGHVTRTDGKVKRWKRKDAWAAYPQPERSLLKAPIGFLLSKSQAEHAM
jgi:hypothetical protein